MPDASSTTLLTYDQKKMSPDIAKMFPGGQSSLPTTLENHCITTLFNLLEFPVDIMLISQDSVYFLDVLTERNSVSATQGRTKGEEFRGSPADCRILRVCCFRLSE